MTLQEYMPLPPPEEDGENSKPNDEPQLQFSYVECLMYSFHRLASRCPEFLTSEDNAEKLKDFRIRYVQVCIIASSVTVVFVDTLVKLLLKFI